MDFACFTKKMFYEKLMCEMTKINTILLKVSGTLRGIFDPLSPTLATPDVRYNKNNSEWFLSSF
jgi:hypothetical protein